MTEREFNCTQSARERINIARAHINTVINMLEKSQWLEERRDDALRTLKYVEYYLGDQK